MIHRLKRKAGITLATFALVGASAVGLAAPAEASSGRVTCVTASVVGMWVDVSGGTDGWATLTSTSNPKIKYWSFNTQGKSWRAFVGCGGTSQTWGSSNGSPWTTRTTGDILCDDVPGHNYCTIG